MSQLELSPAAARHKNGFTWAFHRHNRWTTRIWRLWRQATTCIERCCIKISPWLSPKYQSLTNRWISVMHWVWSFKKRTLKWESGVIPILRQSSAYIQGCKLYMGRWRSYKIVPHLSRIRLRVSSLKRVKIETVSIKKQCQEWNFLSVVFCFFAGCFDF